MSSLARTLKNAFRNTNRRRAARASVAVEPMESRMLLTAMTVEGVVDPNDCPNIIEPDDCPEVVNLGCGGTAKIHAEEDGLYYPEDTVGFTVNGGDSPAVVDGDSGLVDPSDCPEIMNTNLPDHVVDSYFVGSTAEGPIGRPLDCTAVAARTVRVHADAYSMKFEDNWDSGWE